MTEISAGKSWLLLLAAVFAMVWAVARAAVQSITLDEANTYFWFAAREASYIWYPFSNNHVLHTLLMWITTRAFGNSIISIRLPALLGAALYIATCYFLCRRITNRPSLQLSLFICLTYNPFILDYMVAARGYGLADAFLTTALAIPVWRREEGRSPVTPCALASMALGLSFTANFSFGFVDLAAFLAILTWAIGRRGEESIARIIGFCALPGLLLALLICGYPLAHWKREEFWWGAHSLREMRQSLMQSSLYQLNPRFEGTWWYRILDFLRPRIPPLLVILCSCQVLVMGLNGAWQRDAHTRWLVRFAAALAGVAGLSVALSWLAFRFDQLPLPLGRTGIYLVPLCTLIAGSIGAATSQSFVSTWLRRGITILLAGLACYYLFCLRLTYFKEYKYDADLKDVYSVLARLNHSYGVTDVGATGYYHSSLNYYRIRSKMEHFPEFTWVLPNAPAGKPVYVLDGFNDRGILDKEKLAIVYRGKSTDVVVAVAPGGKVPAAK